MRLWLAYRWSGIIEFITLQCCTSQVLFIKPDGNLICDVPVFHYEQKSFCSTAFLLKYVLLTVVLRFMRNCAGSLSSAFHRAFIKTRRCRSWVDSPWLNLNRRLQSAFERQLWSSKAPPEVFVGYACAAPDTLFHSFHEFVYERLPLKSKHLWRGIKAFRNFNISSSAAPKRSSCHHPHRRSMLAILLKVCLHLSN